MRIFTICLTAALALAVATPVVADLETLNPTTARAEMTASKGVVMLALFAQW